MQFIDGLIVIVGMYVFGIQRALYAIIAVYLVTKVSDSLIEGLKFSKQTFIITEKPDEVARVIMEDLDRGATGICGKGMIRASSTIIPRGWRETKRKSVVERDAVMISIPTLL